MNKSDISFNNLRKKVYPIYLEEDFSKFDCKICEGTWVVDPPLMIIGFIIQINTVSGIEVMFDYRGESNADLNDVFLNKKSAQKECAKRNKESKSK